MRRDARFWLSQILATRPGTYTVSGTVTNGTGQPIPSALIQSGSTHFTYTNASGAFSLASLVNSSRTITATVSGLTFSPQSVTVSGTNVSNVNFIAGH